MHAPAQLAESSPQQHPGSGDVETVLRNAEQAAVWTLAAHDRELFISPAGVRRRGSAWFLGAPFWPGADVAPSETASPEFVDLIAALRSEGRSDSWIAHRLMSDPALMRQAGIRNTGLRWIFATAAGERDHLAWIDKLTDNPDAAIRALAIGVLALNLPQSWAQRRLTGLTHDIDDRVFLKALRAIGVLRVSAAWGDLLHITPSPSVGMAMSHANHDAHPVGLGAAHCVLAILQIAGTDDPRVIRRIECEHRPSAALDYLRFESRGAIRNAPLVRHHDIPPARAPDIDLIAIPQNTTAGVSRDFSIARDPVTNAMYDEFVRDFARVGGPQFEHPLQPPGKFHARTTIGDPRFGANHPVSGIDWFDAYAFCRFYGVRLPTDTEWDWAAIGPTSFAAGTPHCFTSVHGRIGHINEWRRILNEMRSDWPAVTTAPVDDSYVSGFGLRHAFGNVWEYTNSNFFTHRAFDRYLPDVQLTPEHYMSLWPFHIVLKGGAWSSIGNLTSNGYSGTDLYSDRHCEIGFRIAAG